MKRDRLAAIMGRTITAMVAGAGCALVGGVVGVALRADLAAVGAVVGASAWLSAHQGLVRRQLRLRLDQLQNSVAAANTELARLCNHHARQLEALTGLYGTLAFRVPLPPLGGFAISADLASLVVREVMLRRPRTIIEFGSGVSTVILGQLAKRLQEQDGLPRTVVSFDHSREYAEATRLMLEAHGLAGAASVVWAPLEPARRDGCSTALTYSTSVLAAKVPGEVDLVLVDGPPAFDGDARGRREAVVAIASRLRDGSLVLFDDARRDRCSIEETAQAVGGTVTYVEDEKGSALLVYQRGAGGVE